MAAAQRRTALICGVTLMLLLTAAGAKRVPWWSIVIARQQGPHACVVEEVPDTGMKLWTECRYWTDRDICGQKTLIRYECCEGYQQLDNRQCTAVKPLRNILETAEHLGARRFVSDLRRSGLAEQLIKDGTFTLFAPTDGAFHPSRMSDSLQAALDSGGSSWNAVLLYHLLDGKLTSREMRGDQLVTTRSGGAKLRLNQYSNLIRTANCHLLLRRDQQATNGIVHIIDGVLDPYRISNIPAVDLLVQDGRFTILANALRQSGYIEELRDLQKVTTILAPSDEAFQKLPSAQVDAIFQDQAALKALLQNHVLTHPICRSAILGEHKMRSQAGNILKFQCDKDKVSVQGSEISGAEAHTEDGVIHVLDDVIIPDRAKSLLELAEGQQEHKLDTFLRLVGTAGLGQRLGGAGDVTVFAPTDAAFRAMPAEWWEETRSDPAAARRLLLLHCVPGRRLSRDISDTQVVTSLDGRGALRLQVHRGALGVEDATIVKRDLQGRNGVLHVIDGVLQPATSSAGDILRQRTGFSTFLRSMETVMTANGDGGGGGGGLVLRSPGAGTFFVPSDEAFRALGHRRLSRLTRNTKMLTKTVKHHISDRMLPAGSFQPNLTYHITTKNGMVDVRRTGDQIMVGKARIIESDIMSTNGIIHVIDKVLQPPRFKRTIVKSRINRNETKGSWKKTSWRAESTESSKWTTKTVRRHRVTKSEAKSDAASRSYHSRTPGRMDTSG